MDLGCHTFRASRVSLSPATVKSCVVCWGLSDGLGSPVGVKLRFAMISPRPTGVYILDTVCSWCMRASVASAPSNSRSGEERGIPCGSTALYRWMAASHTPVGSWLGGFPSEPIGGCAPVLAAGSRGCRRSKVLCPDLLSFFPGCDHHGRHDGLVGLVDGEAQLPFLVPCKKGLYQRGT